MNYSGINWLVAWKLFHYEFFWIHLSLGVPIRLVFAGRRFKTASVRKRILYVAFSSVTSSLVSTWFPIIPLIGGTLLTVVAGQSVGESFVIGAPLIGVLLGVETSFIDAILVRLVLKSTSYRW